MDRETVVKALISLIPNFVESDFSDDSNLLEQRIIDSGQFVDLIVQLEEYSGKEVDFFNFSPEKMSSINGLTKTFNDL